MSKSSLTPRIVALTNDRLPHALALSSMLNWPYRLEDWQFALSLGHGVGAEVDRRLVGTALWWPFEPAFATLGMIIVSHEFQRQGIGRLLMDELMRQASGRTMILCSTRAGQRLYEQVGFETFGSVHQHQAVLAAAPPCSDAPRIRSFQNADFTALCEFDRRAAGMSRTAMMERLLGVGSFVIIGRTGEVAGYACLRRWGRGFVVGPVAASSASDAKILIAGLLASQVGNFVRLDVSDACGLSPWLSELGLNRVDSVTLMARGARPPLDTDASLFALASQSLG